MNTASFPPDHRGKEVLISTLYPLGGNYGGLAQAYALQEVIRGLGFSVRTIDSAGKFSSGRVAARKIRRLLRERITRQQLPLELDETRTASVQESTRRFVRERMRTIDLFGLSRARRDVTLQQTHAIVVGSDQVWRGGYADVRQQLLDYAVGHDLIRMSYAASFGADHLVRYSPRLIAQSARLARAFDAISVREDTGVDLCARHWGVQADHHVDPTLLLKVEDYRSLIETSPEPVTRRSGGIFVYVLDRSESANAVVHDLERSLGLESFDILPPPARSLTSFDRQPGRFRMKPVEAWLAAFADADYVVTDSFHGTVFSIIFNKPFIALGNRSRGLARFRSLLASVGLEERLFDSESFPGTLPPDPDWSRVNERVAAGRELGLHYLMRLLNDRRCS
ncbi:polysaccharide pyruvyl transferase family protein [Tessaracoccus oleiagri]|uniref:Polysaccharide pyruvyl transferase n=1 Tax=Tessaracoccus oleiagri TaxID=686624 RepID=A0A1G9N5I6_9ACTN|nr:polysaccharide pyruvyl transferase family protein [Tessaracoccus oleiagri]SDL81796.1 Polysaccharide pyruvyl transferase [Tessaracoccus oleiagri]